MVTRSPSPDGTEPPSKRAKVDATAENMDEEEYEYEVPAEEVRASDLYLDTARTPLYSQQELSLTPGTRLNVLLWTLISRKSAVSRSLTSTFTGV